MNIIVLLLAAISQIIANNSTTPGSLALVEPINLTNLTGNNGFVVDGTYTGDGNHFGNIVGIGDINGDGKADVVMGGILPYAYVVFGHENGWPTIFNLTSLNGTNGFTISGINSNDVNVPSLSVGDFNGDGKADIVLGDSTVSKYHVVFGNDVWLGQFDLSNLNGTNGFNVATTDSGALFGTAVSMVEDFNGDHVDDLVLLSSSSLNIAYVLFGQASSWPSQIIIDTFLNGTNGFQLVNVSFNTGATVDINGDSKVDLVLGYYCCVDTYGTVYVLFGKDSSWPSQFNVLNISGNNGFIYNGANGDYLGSSIVVGDLNGNGKDDLVLGSQYTVYVLLDPNSSHPFNLTSLNGTNGFVIDGVNPQTNSGSSVTMGDVNDDGKDDLVLGAPNANDNSGMVYVVFGQTGGWSSQFKLTSLNGTNGFVINGVNPQDNFGNQICSGSDINGDGNDDLVLGASIATVGGYSEVGKVYVIFPPVLSPTLNPIPLPDTFNPVPLPDIFNPLSLPNPMIEPHPTAGTPAAIISPNVTACPLNQILEWLYLDIIIANAQSLRLSPMDVSARCGGISSQPYLSTYFRITKMYHVILQKRNASGSWNVDGLSFFGYDLYKGDVELVHDGSQVAPELNITATDGFTTLVDQPIHVNFTLIEDPPVLVHFLVIITPGHYQVTLNTSNIIVSTTKGKLSDLILTVENVQNGYFAQIDAPNVTINDFIYYQVQTGQIQIVQNEGNQPMQFVMSVSDGLKSSLLLPQTVIILDVGKNGDPISKIGPIVGGVVAGVIVLTGCLVAIGYYWSTMKNREDRFKQITQMLTVGKIPL